MVGRLARPYWRLWIGYCACALPAVLGQKGHNFNDPDADHSAAALKFVGKEDMDNALKAFQSAAKFDPTPHKLTDLGVCLMRLNRLDESKVQMDAALKQAKTKTSRDHVMSNLQALDQHLQFRATKKEPVQSNEEESSNGAVLDGVNRPELVTQRPLAVKGQPFRRVTRAELDNDSEGLRKDPFILTDAMDDWGMTKGWQQDGWREVLDELYPTAVMDFYPFNMLNQGRNSPYLTRVPKALKEITAPKASYHFGVQEDGRPRLRGRYMHLQLTPAMWRELENEGGLDPDRHPFLINDEWIQGCLSNGPNGDLIAEEWHLKTHWKIILIGTKGAGMFNHSDSLLTSSWHAHVTGLKWWYVCGILQNGEQACFEDSLKPGEILYYPRHWSHETQCLETPTITVTDTVAHAGNAEGILEKTRGECTGKNPLNFDFSAELCDALDSCNDWWRDLAEQAGETWHAKKGKSWRKEAVAGRVKQAEKMRPEHNNYDGRNYITEL